MSGSQARGLADVAETLRSAKGRQRGCVLLVGAGCSVTAGIPAAPGIVAEIANTYPRAYDRAGKKDYPQLMAELAPAERRDLIARYVDAARLNWAHVCIAQLMRSGFVDRILTTNFDPLVIRSCALLGLFPGVYDFAASQLFSRADIADQSVVYLHGQRSGFALLNTEEEVQRHATLLEPVFDEAGQGRLWIVIGYSGFNDPVFQRLTDFSGFDNGLYWVGHHDNEPAEHVEQQLLAAHDYAYYVGGFDADSFFVQLLQELEVFPPDFISRPFTYLGDIVQSLAPYEPRGEGTAPDFVHRTRKMILDATARFEAGPEAEIAREAQELLVAGKLVELEQVDTPKGVTSEDVVYARAWGAVLEANLFVDQAKTKSGVEADGLFELAGAKYEAALAIKPDKHEALNNWGTTLDAWAKTKSGVEADQLLDLAREKLLAAEALLPGTAAYNLACLGSMNQDPVACRQWLEVSRERGMLPSAEFLRSDPDLTHVRDCEWFTDFAPERE